LFELAKQALPDTPLVRALSFDDIVLHREITNVSLADLPPFSPAGREAYQKLLDSDSPPHTRCDVRWSLPGK